MNSHVSDTDTIAAIATAPGRGGVGILRISGPQVLDITKQLFGCIPPARYAKLQSFCDINDQIIDEGLTLYFEAPHSFTGEHVLELHCHGGPVVQDMLMEKILSMGARQARAGEFSERAYLNDKMDLAQAEAIADLIESSTEQAARAASRSMQGDFSYAVHALVTSLIELRIYVEAAIDFPEEEIDFLSDGEVQKRLTVVVDHLGEVQSKAQQGQLLRDGMNLVIAGRPNAGKSSLLNALAGSETAIVTEVAGTTRDVLREHIQIDGMPLHIIDTAGLRDSDDPIEQEGVRRAWEQIEQADRVLLVIDDQTGFSEQDQQILDRLPEQIPHTLIYNKIDLTGRDVGTGTMASTPSTQVHLSTLKNIGINELKEHLKEVMGYQQTVEGSFSARRRHLDALQRASEQLINAQTCLDNTAGELLAEELRFAQEHLSQITGEFSSDDLLGEIFSGFCIGK